MILISWNRLHVFKYWFFTAYTISNFLDKNTLYTVMYLTIQYCNISGLLSIVETLISLKVDLDLCDLDGRSALHHACCHGNSDIARLLIQTGANKFLVRISWLYLCFCKQIIVWQFVQCCSNSILKSLIAKQVRSSS